MGQQKKSSAWNTVISNTNKFLPDCSLLRITVSLQTQSGRKNIPAKIFQQLLVFNININVSI